MRQITNRHKGTPQGHQMPYNTQVHTTKPMTIDELFEIVTKVIASPHTAITEHDKRRAVQVFLGFDEFMMENVPEYCGDTELGEIDFGSYAAEQLDILEGK